MRYAAFWKAMQQGRTFLVFENALTKYLAAWHVLSRALMPGAIDRPAVSRMKLDEGVDDRVCQRMRICRNTF